MESIQWKHSQHVIQFDPIDFIGSWYDIPLPKVTDFVRLFSDHLSLIFFRYQLFERHSVQRGCEAQ